MRGSGQYKLTCGVIFLRDRNVIIANTVIEVRWDEGRFKRSNFGVAEVCRGKFKLIGGDFIAVATKV